MAYFDKYGVEFSDDRKTLVRCPKEFRGDYVIPDSVVNILARAFEFCKRLVSVTIPPGIKVINRRTFQGCSNLRNVSIPSGVTFIDEWAFFGCYSLTSLKIPNSVNEIEMDAFGIVPNIEYHGPASHYATWGARSLNGYIEGDLIYEDSLKRTLLACSATAKGDVCIPLSVKKIRGLAFACCLNVTSITIPESVTEIGDGQDFDGRHYPPTSKYSLAAIYVPVGQRTRFAQMDGLKDYADLLVERQDDNMQVASHIPIDNVKYLFFDTETTGLPNDYKASVQDSRNWPRLVQIAWLLVENDGNVVKKKSAIIYPNGFTIPQDATNVHHISTEQAKRDGLPLRDVLEEFMQDFEKAECLVAHNIEFDQHIIGAELYRIGEEYDEFMGKQAICTMKSSTNYCALPKLNEDYGYKWPKLEELYYKLFGKKFNDAHDALADITATKECFFELKKRGII